MIWLKKNVCCLKVSSHFIVITKLLQVAYIYLFICMYIICGSRGIVKCLSNKNVRSEYYDRLSYLPVKICICIPLRTLFTQICVHHQHIPARVKGAILLLLYYYHTVMSPMNERWGNLTELRSILHHCRLSSYSRLSPVQTTQIFFRLQQSLCQIIWFWLLKSCCVVNKKHIGLHVAIQSFLACHL